MTYKYVNIFFFIFFFLSQNIYAIEKKAGIDFEKELDMSDQKIDREIIVEGTDEYLFFSTKKKVMLEASASPELETWQEKTDKILVGESYSKKKKSNGKIKFSYGNRNFFNLGADYYGKFSNTLLGVAFKHSQFSHIDLKQEKHNSEQMDTDLEFFSRSRISKKYYVGFSFSGHNRYNRLQNIVPYSRLDKRLFTFGISQEIFVTSFSRVLIDLNGNYAQNSILSSNKNQLAQVGRAEAKITWNKTFKNGAEFELFVLGGYFHDHQLFENKTNSYYSLFSLLYEAKIWETFIEKNRLNWVGYLTLQAQGGNYQNDYQAMASINLESRLADWVSSLEFSFGKKYFHKEITNMFQRYLLADYASPTVKKINGFWKNEIPLGKKVTLEHLSGITYFFQGKELIWDNTQEIWYWQTAKYLLVYNKVGFLFELTPIFFWSVSGGYDYFKPNINQMKPLKFQTGLLVDSAHWLFSLDYKLAGKSEKLSQEKLKLVHLLEFSLSWKINKRFALTLQGKNLLNQKYYWLAPFYEPELTVNFGLEVRL